jgi:AraC family transcriptional regulator
MAKAKSIRILHLRDITLAKIEYKGGFQGIGKAYKKLMTWAKVNAFTNPTKNKTLTIYHDDPNIVGMNNVRQSACIITDMPIVPTEEITMLDFKPGKCVVGRFEVSFFEFRDAWIEMHEWIKKENLTISGKSFEVYQNKSSSHPKKKSVIDICIQVE